MTLSIRLARTAGAIAAASVAVAGLAGRAQESGQIDWHVDSRAGPEPLRLRLEYFRDNGEDEVDRSTALTDLQGLSRAQLDAPSSALVRFRIVRDAGAFDCSGSAADGRGSGECRFQPSASFVQLLRTRGAGEAEPEQLLQLAMEDMGAPFMDELRRERYPQPTVTDLVRAGNHGLNVAWLQGLNAAGVRLSDVDGLVRVHDHGVGPAYIHDLQQVGYHGLDADTLVRLHDHGVSAQYVRAFVEAGYASIPVDELVRLHDHGVSAEYMRGLKSAGYSGLPLEELVHLHDHGVDGAYMLRLSAAGFGKLPTAEVVRLHDRGVGPEFLKSMAEAGYGNLTVEQLVRFRDHGVTAGFIQKVRESGLQPGPEELVRLRDHGY